MAFSRIFLLFIFVTVNLLCRAQTFYVDSLRITFKPGDHFHNTLVIVDSLTNDTIEFDRQISKNVSISLLYENHRCAYRIVNKAHYDKAARKIRRMKRNYFFIRRLRFIFHLQRNNLMRAFNYSKTPEIRSRKILENGKWKHCRNETVVPLFALYDSHYGHFTGKWKEEF